MFENWNGESNQMNARVYHITFETDKAAQDFAFKLAGEHINCHVSFGFGNTQAVVVAYLDEHTEPTVFGDTDYELVEEENTDAAL